MRLSNRQEAARDAVSAAKEAYTTALADLDAEYKYRKSLLRVPLAQAAANAVAEAVPTRQIHMAAGYVHPSGLSNLLGDTDWVAAGRALDNLKAPATTGEYLPVPMVEHVPIVIGDYADMELLVWDSLGRELSLTMGANRDGGPYDGFNEDFKDSPDMDEIKRLIDEKYNTNVIWE